MPLVWFHAYSLKPVRHGQIQSDTESSLPPEASHLLDSQSIVSMKFKSLKCGTMWISTKLIPTWYAPHLVSMASPYGFTPINLFKTPNNPARKAQRWKLEPNEGICSITILRFGIWVWELLTMERCGSGERGRRSRAPEMVTPIMQGIDLALLSKVDTSLPFPFLLSIFNCL